MHALKNSLRVKQKDKVMKSSINLIGGSYTNLKRTLARYHTISMPKTCDLHKIYCKLKEIVQKSFKKRYIAKLNLPTRFRKSVI